MADFKLDLRVQRARAENEGHMVKGIVAGVLALTIGPDLAAQSNTGVLPRIELQQPSPRARVLCGTTIFPADPRVDQRMVKPTPPGTFTLRTVPPPMCRDSFARGTGAVKERLPYFFGPKR